ncbi:MAG: hypothetical protein AAGI23_09530 [Bacteroidota bacterium]
MEKKYKIKEKINELRHFEVSDTKRRIVEKLQVDKSQFYRIMNIPIDSNREAKPSQLLIIAEELGCKIDDLLTKMHLE